MNDMDRVRFDRRRENMAELKAYIDDLRDLREQARNTFGGHQAFVGADTQLKRAEEQYEQLWRENMQLVRDSLEGDQR